MTGVSTKNKGISIIVPILNEASVLPIFIEKILVHSFYENQLIFVDGGSKDDSCKIIEANPNCSLLHSKKGRAIQMNTGAKAAHFNLLYFIHVDSIPPKNFDFHILEKNSEGEKAGCFQLQFDSNHIALRLTAFATRFNSSICRGGDQSLFIEKELFNQLNGYNENYFVCEDGELIDRIYKQTSFCVLPQKLITSARRFNENGVWRLHFLHGIIHLMRSMGCSPKQLSQFYIAFVK